MVTLSKGGQELVRLPDAKEPHKRKAWRYLLNTLESWMRQRRQKSLLQRTEKYDMVKDAARGGWKTEGLNFHCSTNANLLGTLEEEGETQPNYIVNLETGKGRRKIIGETSVQRTEFLKMLHISTS